MSKDKLPFLISKPAEHLVGAGDNAKALNFYAVSVGTLFHLKDQAKMIGKAVAVLFSGDGKDTGTMQRQWASDTQPGVMESEITVEAIRPELAKLRMDTRREAVETIIDALTDDKNLKHIGELIMDSLRDVFPKGDTTNPMPSEFVKSLEGPVLVQMLMGVAKANKGLFGPLAGKLQGMKDQLERELDRVVLAKIGPEGVTAAPPQSPPSDPAMDGSNCKISSSGSANGDTPGPSSSASP